ncbi:hypothetical protein TL16_g00230 [Triparma laevis f. inornata]|uniref:Uncharacterized protein n=1 Tax=Triparma laevis f. inornata TaxID=1714386 RepID=A0A9W6Z9F9_9STRA|nr:hypothetical protein TL16_g00230 [Triparma laevis f. inornata]
MHTPEFRIHFVAFVRVLTLMAFMVATKGWNAAADAQIDEGVSSGDLMVHAGKDISFVAANSRKERCKLITRVIFILNITKVGEYACEFACNLVIVDIPDGIESIGKCAFLCCSSLTTVSFLTTLRLIGYCAFQYCSSLENVDLLHTNLEELGQAAFSFCEELKSMTMPDSLRRGGRHVFHGCSKLVPSNINIKDADAVLAHLRSQQLL